VRTARLFLDSVKLIVLLCVGVAVAGCGSLARDFRTPGKGEPLPRAKVAATDFARLKSIFCLRIDGRQEQHFITGSVHLPLFFRLDVAPEILALVESSEVLLLEATLPPIREEIVESERLRKTLGEFSPPIADKVLEQIDQQLGLERRMSRQAWLRLNPIAINQGLESRIGFPNPRGKSMDAQFVAAARRGQSAIVGIELMKEQVLMVNQISVQQWERIFLDQIAAIGNESRREQLMSSLRSQYRTIEDAQWDEFDAIVRAQDHYLSMLALAVSDVRKQVLADRIFERLQSDHRSHFIALGAAHLGGKQGVLNLLRARGVLLEKNCEASGLS